MYTLDYDPDWDGYFQDVSDEIKKRFLKRREKYRNFPTTGFRHSKHGLPYFVDEIGQYRICFISDEERDIRTFCFIGKHKEYEKFIGVRK